MNKGKEYFSLPEEIFEGMKPEKKEGLKQILKVLNTMKKRNDVMSEIIKFCDKKLCNRCHLKMHDFAKKVIKE